MSLALVPRCGHPATLRYSFSEEIHELIEQVSRARHSGGPQDYSKVGASTKGVNREIPQRDNADFCCQVFQANSIVILFVILKLIMCSRSDPCHMMQNSVNMPPTRSHMDQKPAHLTKKSESQKNDRSSSQSAICATSTKGSQERE